MKQNVVRKPVFLTKDITRIPICVDDSWVDVKWFEGIYEISTHGNLRSVSTGEAVKVYTHGEVDMVVLRHPRGDGSSLCCNLVDVYTSTFLQDNALDQYGYISSIEKRKKQVH